MAGPALPRPACLTGFEATAPVDVARLPAGTQPVRFREYHVVGAC